MKSTSRFLIITAIIWILLAASAADLLAESKNYYFPELRAELYIQPDGSFLVEEYLTFEFQGQFSWASLWVPLSARKNWRQEVSLVDFKVRDESGQELPLVTSVEPGQFRARWNFSARNERRTFHISYRVLNGILSYPEISELYWQIIGPEVDRPTARAEITVHLPQPVSNREQLLVYGHGPLSGRSEIIDQQTVRFEATDIAAHQYLEIRLAWPAGMVTGLPAEGLSREKIKEEENRFVQETIERVRRARESEASRVELLKKAGLAWVFWQIIGPLLWLGLYFYFWKKIGQDYRFPDIPEYFREIPSDLPPALVQVLRREGERPLPVAFTATVFDLATRGYLTIEDEQEEKKTLFGSKVKTRTIFQLKKDYREDTRLRSWEKEVPDLVFNQAGMSGQPGSRVSLDQLLHYLKKHPADYQLWFRNWQKKIYQEGRDLGFIEPQSRRLSQVFLIISIIIASLTFSLVLFILTLILSPKLKRRRKDWARENELWKALDRFLDDFSEFQEIPAEAYKLWDKYLVFAILFGQARKLVKVLPRILGDERAVPAAWIGGSYALSSLSQGVEAMAATISSIERAATSLSQASTQAAHYSSGGGGGFSGGGGGGGGGGGVSAG
ncbi:MAG: DUF2207 domain-containing protein [Candidatus Saccharicenans sp.]|jgi:uncharacterized membrane protein|nr:DUF2207 domain-containing protein [Candidatus Saccharicenans sp.]